MSPRASRHVVRWGVLAVVVALAAVSLLFLRGPSQLQRGYYQLEHEDAITQAALRHKVSPYLIAAVIEAESDWRAEAKSPAGATGLMQVTKPTAKDLARWGIVDKKKYPVDKLSDPVVNIEYGAAYLRYLIERYHEVEPALAAYNAGLGYVDTWMKQGGDIRDNIEFPETRHYVLKVSRAKDRYEALYPDAFEEWRDK